MNWWKQSDVIISKLEKCLIVIMLGIMILIAFTQIILRNFFANGLSWGDPLVRYLVLWVAFIGATLATKEDKHISIDVFSRWVTGLGKKFTNMAIHLVTAIICGMLTFAAITFVKNEAQMGDSVFLNIPAWAIQLIMPVAFGLMTLRFVLRFSESFTNLFKSGADSKKGMPI